MVQSLMGLLVDGKWHDRWYDTASTGGRFVRSEAQFRRWVRADGSTEFAPELDRYHLYVSLACPWAHRTLLFRKLKGLEHAIGVSVVDPLMREGGWVFGDGPGCVPDAVRGAKHLYEIYQAAQPDYTGRVTVPVLWDKQRRTIVNNESSEIIRMFNGEMNALATRPDADYWPLALRSAIEAINERVYAHVNNGVYACGFATTQAAYEQAFERLFATLDELEALLARQRYLVGDRLTEADWRLFTTLVRFDSVYVGHFKCNRRRLVDYPNLWGLTRELYQVPGVAETVDLRHIKQHYYRSHPSINPTGVVPLGPDIDFTAPLGRARLA